MTTWILDNPEDMAHAIYRDRDRIRTRLSIRDTKTGEVATGDWHDFIDRATGKWGDYIWRDGNFACDCNRGLFFGELTHQDPEDEEAHGHVCGHKRYRIRIVNPADGAVMYEDGDWPEEAVS